MYFRREPVISSVLISFRCMFLVVIENVVKSRQSEPK